MVISRCISVGIVFAFVVSAASAQGTYTANSPQPKQNPWSVLKVTLTGVRDFKAEDHEGWKNNGVSFRAAAAGGPVNINIQISGTKGRSYFDYTTSVVVKTASGKVLLSESPTVSVNGATVSFSTSSNPFDGSGGIEVSVSITGGNPEHYTNYVNGVVEYSGKVSPVATPRPTPSAQPPVVAPPSNVQESGAHIAGLIGQVWVHHATDSPGRWTIAKLETTLNAEDHIRTDEDSSCILALSDMSTFVLKPESEVVVVTPPEKMSKMALVAGNIWINFQKMIKDGSMEVDLNQAVAGIKGTTLSIDTSALSSTLHVFEGTVEFRSKANGQVVLVHAGESVSAGPNGLRPVTPFDVARETADWNAVRARTGGARRAQPTALPMADETWLINTATSAGVQSGPTAPTTFTVSQPMALTMLFTYHFAGRGRPAGELSLRHEDGTLYGPWKAALTSGVYWVVNFVTPGAAEMALSKVGLSDTFPVLKPGKYTVVDSSPNTWSYNIETRMMGVTLAKGITLRNR